MPFNIRVTNDLPAIAHRVVPVRFARAIDDFARAEAPDIDDQGFALDDRRGPALGPSIGIIKTRQVRVAIVRDRLESTAQLFVTSDDPAIAEVIFPEAGTALNPADTPANAGSPLRQGDNIFIRATSTASGSVGTKVKVRFGAADGPVLAELGVRVHPLLSIRFQAHNVSINGTAATTTIAQARALVVDLNHVYAQAGIQFNLLPTLLTETLTGFATAGFVTLSNVADARNIELQTVLNSNPTNNALNCYFVPGYRDIARTPPEINSTLGIAFSRTQAAANPADASTGFPGCRAGITVFLGADAKLVHHTSAHEIGHSLTLRHYDNVNNGAAALRNHVWAHRNLMFPLVNFLAGDGFNIGYGTFANGTNSCGQLLGAKRRTGLVESDQVGRSRDGQIANSFAP